MSFLRKTFAEMLGTFFLCFAGISAILVNTSEVGGHIGLLGIAFAHGLALSIGVSVTVGISGGHLNPAVTLGMLVTGRIRILSAIGYIIAQCLGATFAALLCNHVFPPFVVTNAHLGLPLPAKAWVTDNMILLYEGVMTFLLVTAVFGTVVDERAKSVKIGVFAIGLTVCFDILAGGPITGASMNPARSFGPAFVLQDFARHWCYWVGPAIGGIAAAIIYQFFLLREDGAA
jgi:MIP family channel proteins